MSEDLQVSANKHQESADQRKAICWKSAASQALVCPAISHVRCQTIARTTPEPCGLCCRHGHRYAASSCFPRQNYTLAWHTDEVPQQGFRERSQERKNNPIYHDRANGRPVLQQGIFTCCLSASPSSNRDPAAATIAACLGPIIRFQGLMCFCLPPAWLGRTYSDLV